MDERKLKELEAKLQEMLGLSEQTRIRNRQRRSQPSANVVIRRRKGEKDKRILLDAPS